MDKTKLLLGIVAGVVLYGGVTVLGASVSGGSNFVAAGQLNPPAVSQTTTFAALWRKVGGEITVAPNKFAATAETVSQAQLPVSQTSSPQGQSGAPVQQVTQTDQNSCYLTGRYLVCNGQTVGVIEGNGGDRGTGN